MGAVRLGWNGYGTRRTIPYNRRYTATARILQKSKLVIAACLWNNPQGSEFLSQPLGSQEEQPCAIETLSDQMTYCIQAVNAIRLDIGYSLLIRLRSAQCLREVSVCFPSPPEPETQSTIVAEATVRYRKVEPVDSRGKQRQELSDSLISRTIDVDDETRKKYTGCKIVSNCFVYVGCQDLKSSETGRQRAVLGKQ
ncbi:hypothetical protein C8J56DRAFT_901437 [Mycena floridula]|nr:hypothetical protein C8J56DRAFT_901437 [Mycena floridula]